MEDKNEIQINVSNIYKQIAEKSLGYIREKEYEVDLNYYINNDVYERFFIARDNDENAAFIMWKNWINWRVEAKPDQIDEKSIENELKGCKSFMHGFDRQGRPCLVVKANRHFPDKSNYDESFRYGIYMMEKACNIADEKGVKQLVVIFDRENVTLKNIDYKMLGKTGLAQLMQDFYAERLHKIYILHVNWIFKMMYNIIKVFLSKKTKEKIHILSGVGELKNYFDDDNLLKEHGGNSNYIHTYPNQTSSNNLNN